MCSRTGADRVIRAWTTTRNGSTTASRSSCGAASSTVSSRRPAGSPSPVTVAVAGRAFQHWDDGTHRWATEAGGFRLHVGPSSGVLPLELDVQVQEAQD